MAKIFEKANDQHVRSLIVYGKTADSKLYKEAAYTNKVSQAEMEDAFLKGMLIIKDGDNYFTPAFVAGNKVNVAFQEGAYADAFDATETYAVGDYCTKDSKNYICSTAITVAAAWDSSNWTDVTGLTFKEWTTVATA